MFNMNRTAHESGEFEKAVTNTSGKMSPEVFNQNGIDRRQPTSLRDRWNQLSTRGKFASTAVVAGAAAAAIALTGEAIKGADEQLRVPGSNNEAFCVKQSIIPDSSYESRLGAISVYEGELVDAATVKLEAIPENHGGGHIVTGNPC